MLGGDILQSETIISNNLGFCLEEDHLEEGFTLFYHLFFLGKLKGLTSEAAYKQIFYIGKLLDLERHFFKPISSLSGGTKRKASISATLIGGPNLILIDEPTKNLDPIVSRNLLLAMHYFVKKLNRAMLYTTKKKEELYMIADNTLSLTKAEDHWTSHVMESVYYNIKIKVLYSFIAQPDCKSQPDPSMVPSYSPGSEQLHILLESSTFSHEE